MPVEGENDTCPKCRQETLYREIWLSSEEFREECSECGYFREETLDSNHLGEERLGAMHFRVNTHPYVREGFIRKTAGSKGQYYITRLWFSSPSYLEGLEVDWIDVPT